MAGFLIVEGDVDEAVNRAMTGEPWPDPTLRNGPFDYRERLIFIQRVQLLSLDLDAGKKRRPFRAPPLEAINGIAEPGLKRVPPPYPTDHKRADLLRRKGLAVWIDFDDAKDALRPDIVAACTQRFERLEPISRWIRRAG